jgi:hypothetical protein
MTDTFERTAVRLSQGPLGIIALFIVLIHAFASLVIGFATDLGATNRTVLVWFIVLFPVIVFFVFAWLVSCHHVNLYPPQAYRDQRDFRELAMYGHARFDQRDTPAVEAKELGPDGHIVANATGNLFWLGHDLMWTADVLLRGGTPEDARVGFDQALHHLGEVGLGDGPVASELQRLRDQVQKTPMLSPSLRDAFATQLGSIIDRLGAMAEAAQPTFRIPPHWKRVRRGPSNAT